ncbi:phosphate ABC transporter permease PstA [Candidatus Fermentibacteria bacterium]|nr:phosphate ABC transporter permease PstA [Candidatus Fermentibacteria bacterium]
MSSRSPAGRKLVQAGAFSLLWVSALLSVLVLASVVGYVMIKGIPELNLSFFTTPPRGGLSGEGGISSTIVATLYLVVMTLLVAAPLGIGAGVFLVEYAESMQNRLMKPLIRIARFGVETLAGVPSIIFGLFGYALFVTLMHFGFSLLSASLAGACLILPVVIRTTEEALKAVPQSYREGSLSLGATRWETIRRVVLPSAVPGITTGMILGVGRIISETAVFYVTLGGSYRTPTSILSSGRTMALHVFYLAMETRAFEKAMATGAVLIACIIAVNLAINAVSRRLTAGGGRW